MFLPASNVSNSTQLWNLKIKEKQDQERAREKEKQKRLKDRLEKEAEGEEGGKERDGEKARERMKRVGEWSGGVVGEFGDLEHFRGVLGEGIKLESGLFIIYIYIYKYYNIYIFVYMIVGGVVWGGGGRIL